MSLSRWLAPLAATMGFLAVAAVIDACSSNDPDTNAAPDATDVGTRDGSYVFEEAEAKCDPDADILVEVKDAAIGDGSSTTGICVECMREKCATPLATCARDCLCQGIMRDAIECYLTTQNIVCLGKLTSYLLSNETRTKALAVAGCAQAGCPTECAVEDAGPPEAGADAAGDAPADADAGADADADGG